MRPRITTKVDIAEAMQQIENDVKKYTKAIKAIMELKQIEYRDARRVLEMRIDCRTMLKTN
jgi:hypothetical protein